MLRHGRHWTLLNGSVGIVLFPREDPVADLNVLNVLGGEMAGDVNAGGDLVPTAK